MSTEDTAMPIPIQELLTRESNDKMVAGKIRYLDTATAYDLWSKVYDTDGNFLQALDTVEIPAMLKTAFTTLPSDRPVKVVDLGCGTGRNTLQILSQGTQSIRLPWEITAVDLSPKMLGVAKSVCEKTLAELQQGQPEARVPEMHFSTFDMIVADSSPEISLPIAEGTADVVVSTLVLEHVPLPTFMRTASRLLAPGGVLILTNMHSQMGGISQAGFVDPTSGDKIRPVSYAHTVVDTMAAAKEAGLECCGRFDGEKWTRVADGKMKEISINEDLAGTLGVRAKKWVGISVWFGGVFSKRGDIS